MSRLFSAPRSGKVLRHFEGEPPTKRPRLLRLPEAKPGEFAVEAPGWAGLARVEGLLREARASALPIPPEIWFGLVDQVLVTGQICLSAHRFPSGATATFVLAADDVEPRAELRSGARVALVRWWVLEEGGAREERRGVLVPNPLSEDDRARLLELLGEGSEPPLGEEAEAAPIVDASGVGEVVERAPVEEPGGGEDGAASVPVYRAPRLHPSHLPDGELGVVVFGPGDGEAMVVKLPDGRWGVVDGCLEPSRSHRAGTGDPVREFLNEAETPAGPVQLAFVAWTHPHADHYRGLRRLLDAYRGRVERLISVAQVEPRFMEAFYHLVRHQVRRPRRRRRA